jgi:hypothetical protein
MPPNTSPRPVEISIKHSNAQNWAGPVRRYRTYPARLKEL